MKTILTLLLTTISTAAFAYDEGKITITLASNKNYVVYVNGRQQFDQDNMIVLNDVRSGNHTIKVYQRRKNNRNSSRRNDDRDFRNNDLVYSTTVYVKPSYHVDVMINRFGKALVDEQQITRNRWEDDWQNDNNGGYNRVMSDNDFNQLTKSIREAWFSSDKMRTARNAFERNAFNTSQVRQVLTLFSSDSDKLELAKLVYRNTVDQRAYYQLYDVFSFQSSKDELDKYIRDFRY
jgi:hypothetical protein